MARCFEGPNEIACLGIETPEMTVAVLVVAFADVDSTASDRGWRKNWDIGAMPPDDLL